ncbi:MAG: catalase [Clostridium sp.]|uniref:catalase n=1 Tax=Clostridium sp. TaxID=1506 RepID=UPI003F2DF3DE
MDKKELLSTEAGVPVGNDNQSLSTDEGYVGIQDSNLIEKLAHFSRERIPERVVHAKAAGAHGYFEVTNDMSKYTRAKFLSKVGKRVNVLARLSTVGGESGTADTARDPRGFALKFYTEEGNYDMVGNNTPVFFIRDAIKFPDFVHTQKRNPKTHLKDANMYWDFLSLNPESIHQVTYMFTDTGTPRDVRHIDGYSSHTYMWYNDKNQYVWVKYTFKTDLGRENLTIEEATELATKNPDSSISDLFNNIENGNYPSWTLYVQIMTPKEAEEYKFDPFDVTKVWYHKDFPLIPVGKLVLNKNPENYFEEIEEAAFSPSNFVPGIAASPDKLLQGRLFAYKDAQRYRLGVNNNQLKVNRPKVQVNTKERDGYMALDNGGSRPNYYENSFENIGTDTQYNPPAVKVSGILAKHKHEIEDIDFIQPGEFYRRVLKPQEKENLVHNISIHLSNAIENIQYRQTALFYKVDIELGTKISEQLKLDILKVKELADMSKEDRAKATMNY